MCRLVMNRSLFFKVAGLRKVGFILLKRYSGGRIRVHLEPSWVRDKTCLAWRNKLFIFISQ